LAVRCIVQKSRLSSNVKVKGQRSKVKVTGDKKRKSAPFYSGVVLWGAVVRQFCAGVKISACCMVLPFKLTANDIRLHTLPWREAATIHIPLSTAHGRQTGERRIKPIASSDSH